MRQLGLIFFLPQKSIKYAVLKTVLYDQCHVIMHIILQGSYDHFFCKKKTTKKSTILTMTTLHNGGKKPQSVVLYYYQYQYYYYVVVIQRVRLMEIEIKVEQFSTVLTLKKWSYKLLHSWQKKFLRFSMVFFWSAECTLPSNGSKKRETIVQISACIIQYAIISISKYLCSKVSS